MKTNNEHIGRKPTGLSGILIGYLMNTIHKRLYQQIIDHLRAEVPSSAGQTAILDVGCGGGSTVKSFCENFENSKVVGLDHSNEMVALSSRVNRKHIAAGNVEIVLGDVSKLPFGASQFNLVSSFDTINLWTDLETSVTEIWRVLAPGGLFVIVNAYPKEGTKWWRLVRFKTDKEYVSFLEKHSFGRVQTELLRNTIIVRGRKKS